MPSPRPGFSTFTTSAPMSPSSDVHHGPAAWWLRSITRTPASGSARRASHGIARGVSRRARAGSTSGAQRRPLARDYRLISADSHVLEPPHLWTTYMPKKFHDKCPKVVPDGDGGEAWQFAPDIPPAPIGIYASAGRRHEEVRWTGVTFAAANQGNFRAEPRLAEMDADGVDAEVLFGSARMMSHFFSDPDPEFHLAGVRAFNDWLAEEFVQKAPDRLIGLTAMPALGDVRACIAEMERGIKLGMRGVWLNTMPSAGPTIRPED